MIEEANPEISDQYPVGIAFAKLQNNLEKDSTGNRNRILDTLKIYSRRIGNEFCTNLR